MPRDVATATKVDLDSLNWRWVMRGCKKLFFNTCPDTCSRMAVREAHDPRSRMAYTQEVVQSATSSYQLIGL
jgi:hypothetical protein